MSNYEIYMHNELQIMVAKGNPKAIAGIDDLVRADVRTSMPNPVNEGIMQFYARKVLERHGLWADDCERPGMRLLPDHGAKLVHRRSSPGNARNASATTNRMPASSGRPKVMEALRHGAQIETVELPAVGQLARSRSPMPSARSQNSRHKENADNYLAFLRSDCRAGRLCAVSAL